MAMDVRITDDSPNGFVANVNSDGALRVEGTVTTTGSSTANQGTPGAVANAWPVKITDGSEVAEVTTALALKVDGSAVTQPVSGSVSVANFPAVQPVNDNGGSLTVDGTVTANAGTGTFTVRDDYQTFEALDDQTGAGGVLTFTFSSARNLIVVDCNGLVTDVARVMFGTDTPTATKGFVCRDESPAYIPMTATTVKVFAPSGVVVSVSGFGRS